MKVRIGDEIKTVTEKMSYEEFLVLIGADDGDVVKCSHRLHVTKNPQISRQCFEDRDQMRKVWDENMVYKWLPDNRMIFFINLTIDKQPEASLQIPPERRMKYQPIFEAALKAGETTNTQSTFHDFCLELLFMKAVVGEREMDLKDVRRLRGIERELIGFIKEKLGIANFTTFDANKEQIISLFDTIALLNQKFPNDLEVILTAFRHNESLNITDENRNFFLKRLKLFATSCEKDFPIDFFYYCLENKNLNPGLIRRVVDNPLVKTETKEKYVILQPDVVAIVGLDEVGTRLQALFERCKKDDKHDFDPDLLDRIYGKAIHFINQISFSEGIDDIASLNRYARSYCSRITDILQAIEGYVETLETERDPLEKFRIKQNIDNLVKIIEAGFALETDEDHKSYLKFLDYTIETLIRGGRTDTTKACADWEHYQHLALNFLEHSKIENVDKFTKFCNLVLEKEHGGCEKLRDLYTDTHTHFDKLTSYFDDDNADYRQLQEQGEKLKKLEQDRAAFDTTQEELETKSESLKKLQEYAKRAIAGLTKLGSDRLSAYKLFRLQDDFRKDKFNETVPGHYAIFSKLITEIENLLTAIKLIGEEPSSTKLMREKLIKEMEEELDGLNYDNNEAENIASIIQHLDSEISKTEKSLKEVSGDFDGYVKRLQTATDRDPTGSRDVDLHVQFDDSSLFLADRINRLISQGREEDAGHIRRQIRLRRQIQHSFHLINSVGRVYAKFSKKDLQEKIKKVSQSLSNSVDLAPEKKYGAQIELLALLRESCFRVDHKFAYSTQFLPILYLMHADEYGAKKLMAEIATGQGKSLITALYSSFQALSGNAVHITSSTDALSIRDYFENKRFYEYIGLESFYIDNNGISKGGAYKKGAIYHYSQSNLYFFCAKAHLEGRSGVVAVGDRVLISDEADTMLDNKTTWRLAVGDERENKLKDLYPIVNGFYAENKDEIDDIPALEDGQEEAANEIARSFLDLLRRDYLDLYNALNDSVGNSEELLLDKAKSLLASARYAATLAEGKDYMVEAIETKIREAVKKRFERSMSQESSNLPA